MHHSASPQALPTVLPQYRCVPPGVREVGRRLRCAKAPLAEEFLSPFQWPRQYILLYLASKMLETLRRTARDTGMKFSMDASRALLSIYLTWFPIYRNAIDVLIKIARVEGPAQLWRGTDLSLAVCVPAIALYFPLYEHALQHLQSSGIYCSFCILCKLKSLSCLF